MKLKCERVEQIAATLENRPGILADLCAHLADHQINIRAIAALENLPAGNARMVVDNPDEAKRVLEQAGVAFTSTACLALKAALIVFSQTFSAISSVWTERAPSRRKLTERLSFGSAASVSPSMIRTLCGRASSRA